jgi:hypothetical protein
MWLQHRSHDNPRNQQLGQSAVNLTLSKPTQERTPAKLYFLVMAGL